MFPTVLRHQLRDAAYARLYASEKLAGGLLKARDPAHQRIILQEILENGQKNLDQMAQSGDPYLVASTYLSMAEACFDLSEIAANAAEKENLLHRSLDYADLASGSALESEYSLVPLAILPELLVMLTRALGSVTPPGQVGPTSQMRLLQMRIRNLVGSLAQAADQQTHDRRQAARELFEVQTLAESAYWLDGREDQKKVLQKAQELALRTLQKARGAGDRNLTVQVQRVLVEIERGLKF